MLVQQEKGSIAELLLFPFDFAAVISKPLSFFLCTQGYSERQNMRIFFHQETAADILLGLRLRPLSVKDNQGNSFLVNYCKVKFAKGYVLCRREHMTQKEIEEAPVYGRCSSRKSKEILW